MKIGLESLVKVDVDDIECSMSIEDAADFDIEMQQMQMQLDQLMSSQKELIIAGDLVAEYGITDTFKAIYGEEFAAAGINLDEISQEGLGDVIGDFMQALTKKMIKLQGWFEDKFKSMLDAHYAGIKYLTKFKQEKTAAVKSMSKEKFGDAKARVYPRKEFDAFLKATGDYIAKAPTILKKTDITNGKELTPFLTPLGHGVNVQRSKVLGYEYPTLVKTTGFPETKKDMLKNLGYGLGDVLSLTDKVLKVLEQYTYLNEITANAYKAYMAEVSKIEKDLAKGKSDDVAEAKMQLNKYNYTLNFQMQVGMLQFRAVRQLSKQMRQITKKVTF